MTINLDKGKDQYTPAEVEELIRKNDEATAERLEVLEAVSKMNDAEKAHYATLEGDAEAEFLYMDSTERAAQIEKSVVADPVVYTMEDGTEILKSHGPMTLKMARDRDADQKQMKELIEKQGDLALAKTVETDYANLPGTLDVRKAIVKAVTAIDDEAVREEALKALKAQNAQLGAALTTVGSTSAPLQKNDAEAELETLVKAHQTAHPELSYYDAYGAVSEANPDLYSRAVMGQ